MEAQPLARVIRGDTVESVHRGHLVVMDGNKRNVASVGDPEAVTFIRSAAKAIQAIPFITSGAAARFGMNEAEVALACASHSGEKIHVELAAQMLAKAEITENDLKCGTHLPFDETEAERMMRAGEKPTQLHNNCSGKHAAMLAFAKQIGADIATYDSPQNPIQQEILKSIAAFSDLPAEDIGIGIDGCAAPNFAMPLNAMARSYANLINPPNSFSDDIREACRRIVTATLNHPHLIGGTGRLDTMLIQAAPGRIVSKVGAEGVWLCGVLPNGKFPKGLAIAMKIEDGDDRRARRVAAVAILNRLRVGSPGDLPEFSPMPIKNRRGDTVGRVEAVLAL